METKANYVRVGIFTLVVLALAIGFTYWTVFASKGDNRVLLLVRIEGSVTGLQQGSNVLFNGLPVGQVTGLRIDNNNPGVVIASTLVDPTIPIKDNTQANIGFQGLTGYAFIELKGGTPSQGNLIEEARAQGVTPVIKANPSDVTDILATARDIANRANNILGQFESIVKDAGPGVQTTIANVSKTSQNVETFTAALARNTGNIDSFVDSLSKLTVSARNVAEALPGAIARAQAILGAVDTNEVSQIVDNVTAVTANVRQQSDKFGTVMDAVQSAANGVGKIGTVITNNADGIDSFISSLGPLANKATDVAGRLDTTLQSTNKVIAAVDPAKVSQTLDGVSTTATNVASLSQTLKDQARAIDGIVSGAANAVKNVEAVTKTVADRREQIDETIANLAPLSDTANRVANRVDVTLQNADRLVASVDPDKVAAAVDAFSSAATNVASITKTVDDQKEAISTAISGIAHTAQNVNQITTTVAARLGEIDKLMASLGPITANVTEASEKLNTTLDSAKRVVDGVDTAGIDTAIGNVTAITSAVREKTPEIQSIIERVNTAVATINTAVNGFSETRAQVDTLLASVDPAKVNAAVDNVSAATDNVAKAANSIAGVANDIGEKRPDIDRIIANVDATSQNLKTASSKIDSVINSVNGVFAGAGNGNQLGSDLAGALTSVRDAARSIQAQIKPISADLQRFSGQGLQQFQTLMRSVNRTVDRIDNAVSDFSSDPSRILYGGDQVKQFNGRTRR
ncbi:MlaD family protein [Jiella sp. MQZ9-1]|uniref:MCE family protein n=1 Tax=Jiella flava TaxID=2816857 RepID=A0A939FY76_9HYPH|nr:MlaD family protein [Jiella flava]MBO0662926.1 MCE family protein [Jiella flava]MCD2471314.1 MlaD family protein [Jiella flava]